MVKGLQEREKVKGVLNKVVSREIAQEILKGSVHLGGEEKTVTVLFADIRDFTKMTPGRRIAFFAPRWALRPTFATKGCEG